MPNFLPLKRAHSLRRRGAGGLALLAWLLLLLPQLSHAQTAASYGFSQATGATYTPITGGAVLGTATNDDQVYTALPIGFTFTYAGASYTTVSVNANGWLRMGGSISSSYTGLSSQANAIAALNRDLQGTAANASEMRYQTIGTAPNQQLVMQWKGYRRYYSSSTNTDNLNFQIILNQTTNTVQFAYGSNVIGGSATNTSGMPQVGINGAALTDYNDRTSTTSWTATTAGTSNAATITLSATVVPPSGLVYTFTPPAGCAGTPTAGTTAASPASICSGSSTISLTGGSTDTGLSFQLQSSATSGGTYTNVGTAATTASFTVAPTASTYYRIITTCIASTQTAASTPVQVVVSPVRTYAALPYTQTFEATWASTCGTRDVPDANWRSSPLTGDNAWRRYDDGTAGGWSSTSGGYTLAGSNAGGASSSFSGRFHSYNANGTVGTLDLYANASGGTGTPTLTFDYINTSGSDKLEVLLSTDGGQTFGTALFSQVLATSWTSYTVPLNGATATSVIRFQATGDNGSTDIGLDNVAISYVACSPVTSLAVGSLTPTSASLSFTAPTGGASYTVTYTPTGGPATTITPAPTASPVPLTGLTPGTTYAVSVVTNCAGSTTSTAATTTFTTPASPPSFTTARGTGLAYTSIQSTGTSFSWMTPANTDDNVTTTVPLTAGSAAAGSTAFAFSYLGTAITGFQVSTNGWLTFKTSNTTYNGSTAYTNNLSDTNFNPLLAPFWEDLVLQGNPNTAAGLTAAKIKYQVSGTAPSRTLTVEWAEMETYQNPGPSLNFQVILTETTNTIEYRYGNMSGFDGSQNFIYTYSLGLNSAAGTYLAQDVANSNYFLSNNASTAAPTIITATTTLTAAQRGNSLSIVPACFSNIKFTPAASFTPGTAPTATAPANDEASAATVLALGTAAPTDFCAVYTSANATASTGITACSATTAGTPDDDVWFKFVVPAASSVTVTLRSSGTYDGVLQLFNADGSGTLLPASPVACANATGAGLTEGYTGNLAAGTYYVRVYEAGTGSAYNGTFVVAAYATPTPPANDECVAAISLPATSTTCTPVSGTTLAATASASIPVCGATTPGTPDDDVWYSFTTSASTSAYTITLQGASGFDGVLQLLSGTCGSLTAVSCANATSTAGVEVLNPTGLTASTTYYLRVYHAGSGSGTGSFTICVTPTCTAPTAVSSTSVTPTTASITFTAGTGGTSYTVTATPTTGPAVTATGTASPIALTGLAPSTMYSVVVASDCGASSTAYSFTTQAACTAPTSANSNSVTATSANITFTAGNGNTSYTVTYTPTGGTATTVTPAPTASPVPLTGLLPGTTYTVSVTGNCTSGATTAITTTFTTAFACATPTYAALPYTQTFEGTFASSCALRDVPDLSWKNTPSTADADASFRRYDDGASAGWTSTSGGYTPAGSNAGGATSAFSARFHSYDASTGTIGLLDLYANASGGTGTPTLTFDYINTSGSDKLEVLLSTDGGQTFGTALFSQVLATSWTNYIVALPGATATSVIRFRATGDFGLTDIGLDNVNVSLVACAPVAALTAGSLTLTSASLSFTAPTGGASYTVTYTPTGGPATTVTPAPTASPVPLTGLTPGTTYAVSVVTNCAGSTTSTAATTTFTTPIVNDDPTGAIALTIGASCTPTNGTNVGATTTTANGYANPGTCGAAINPKDVWYSFTTAAGQTGATVTVTGNPAGLVRVFSASSSAGPFTQVGCSAGSTNNMVAPALLLSGLTPSTTYYISVAGYGSGDTQGAFTICLTSLADLVVDGTNSPYSASGTYNNVTINSGGTANLSADLTVLGMLTINDGGTLNTAGNQVVGTGNFQLLAGGTLGIRGTNGISVGPATTGVIRNTGTTRLFSTDANYVYNGTAAQTTGAGLPGTVRSLTTTNAAAVTLTNPVSVTQTVTVGAAGNLELNGNALTLLSSATGTALVVNAGTGIVSGSTATVQRYLDPSLNPGLGYRHYASPVQSTTVADLATAGFTPVVNSNYNTSATPATVTPFPTVYGYDQARLMLTSNNLSSFDKGFLSPATTGTIMVPGQGFAVNIGASQLVDFVGALNNGDVSQTLARNSGATAANAGWQLVGNPYPAPLDYSLVAPADRANLDAAIYVVQSSGQYTGSYRTYVNGQSTSASNNPLIGSSQGFFVRVSAGQTSGTLTFRNSQRVTSYANQAAVYRSTADTRPVVALELRTAAGQADKLVVYAEAGATPTFDSQYDAAKLANSTGLNLSSTATSGESLAIDGRPAFTARTTLPLAVGVPAAGTYSLDAKDLSYLPAGLDAYLRDAQTGQTTKLSVGTSYSFAVTATEAQALVLGRFTLLFGTQSVLATATALTAADVSVYPNPAHERFTVLVPAVAGATKVQAELLNSLGQVVLRQSAALPAAGATLTVPTAELNAGIYTLRLTAGSTTLAKRVTVQ